MFRIRHSWLASILVLATAAAAVADDSIPWITDLAQARQLAEQQQRLVLLHFWGDGCPPCQQLEANVFNQPELIRLLSTNFVCVKIHTQQQPNIANYYKITKIPTDIIVLPSGAQVFRTTSPANVNQYMAMLDQVRANALASGFQQADQVARNFDQAARNTDQVARNALQQFTSNLPLLANRTPEDQPAGQTVNSENSLQQNPQPTWRNAPAESSSPPQSAVVNNEFVGPLDQPAQPPTRPEVAPTRPTSGSRYGNPYLNNDTTSSTALAQGGATTSSIATNNSDSQHAPQAAASEPEAASPHVGGGETGPSFQRQQSLAAAQPANTTPTSVAGNQTWTPNTPSMPIATPNATSMPVATPNTPPMPNAGVNTPQREIVQGIAPRTNTPTQPQNQPNAPQLPPGVPPLALDGHCAVTLMNLGKWEKGDVRFGAVHRDRTYLFKSQVERDRFLAPGAADRFAPVLSGLDPVRFAESGQAVDGRREHGVLFDGQIFLFADEEALVRFEREPHRYVAVVRQAMANSRNAPQR